MPDQGSPAPLWLADRDDGQDDKAIYEIGYELNNRPEWTQIPLKGLLELFETER